MTLGFLDEECDPVDWVSILFCCEDWTGTVGNEGGIVGLGVEIGIEVRFGEG